MTTEKRDTELSLEIESHDDDAAFEEAALDDELDDSMAAAPVVAPRKKGKAKLLAGVLVLGVLGAGGFFAYQSMMAGGATPTAAVPADVPANTMAGMDALTPPGTIPGSPDAVAMDPFGAPADPNAAPGMMAADGGMTPPAPMAPDAVMADGGLPAAEPMPGFDPMNPPADAGMAPDPMAAFTQPADAGLPPAQPIDPLMGNTPPADQMPVDAMAGPAMDAQPGLSGANAPVDATASVETAGVAAPVMEMAAPANPTPAPAPVMQAPPVVPAPSVEPPVDALLRGQVVTLENRVAELEAELKTLRDRPAPVAETSGVSEAEFAALKRRVEEMAAAPKPAPAAPPAPAITAVRPLPAPVNAAAPVPSQPVVPATVRALTRVEQATAGGRATATNPSVSPTPPAAPARTTAPSMGVNWQLRSAQPGRAWIAQPGTQEMRSIAVGDEVPGLGRILSIAQGADSRWVVRGSMGSVNQ